MPWKLNEKFFAERFEKRPEYALHVAARFGDIKFMQQLIDNGHDLEKFDSVYGTPLHVAIKCNQLQAFQLLLSAGADPEALDSRGEGHGDNSLRLAVRVGRREMFKILWDKGVDRRRYHPDVYSLQRLSLLEVAAFETPDAIVADLVEWSDEWTDLDLSRSLVVASTHHRAGVLKILLGWWNFRQEQLDDAIWFCCDSGPCLDQSRDEIMDYSERQAKSVEAILDSRPTLELNTKLLRISENWYSIPTMKLLLERGANPNFPCSYSGKTPLQLAVEGTFQRPNEEGINLLLLHGADSTVLNGSNMYSLIAGQKKNPHKQQPIHSRAKDAVVTAIVWDSPTGSTTDGSFDSSTS